MYSQLSMRAAGVVYVRGIIMYFIRYLLFYFIIYNYKNNKLFCNNPPSQTILRVKHHGICSENCVTYNCIYTR